MTATHHDISVGDTVDVHLDENLSTGYIWQLTADSSITVTKEFRPDSNDPKRLGGGGTRVFSLTPTKAGDFHVHFQKRRPWLNDTPTDPTMIQDVYLHVED